MCQCIFCDEIIDNPATAISLAGDRMHPECYHTYMDELGEVDPCGGYCEDSHDEAPYASDWEYDCQQEFYEEYPW